MSNLSPAQRAAARARLDAERASTEARIAALGRDFESIVSSSASAADDEHDPEGSSTAFDRQHVAALLGQAREHLTEIARAEQRLGDGSYGRCERCGQPIGPGRLEARPATATCVACAGRATRQARRGRGPT
ncbi:MAG TPA: TraR/DksA C4-type zinc finger protein [Streptosporangiaceae bacterium]|nr:TraR/DksA C4-type zinc finger protein [Streptosporangiaceae bacterium]